jgi:hypothetical protein
MFPSFIKHYWVGLVANSTRNGFYSFSWTDPAVVPPTTGSYIHWGRVRPANTSLQPDNFYMAENCGVANASETFVGAFGWSDCQCNITAPFMCKAARKAPHARPPGLVTCQSAGGPRGTGAGGPGQP